METLNFIVLWLDQYLLIKFIAIILIVYTSVSWDVIIAPLLSSIVQNVKLPEEDPI